MFRSRLYLSRLSTLLKLPSSQLWSSRGLVDISSEVISALNTNKPVVALESTIITHGMPYPDNLKTALAVESVVRDQGAIPATIAVLQGRIKVGLCPDQLEILSNPSAKAVKISRRDFPYVLSHKLNGGTTVSGTLIVANSVGIKVFVTGGVGGVHRHGESTLDISADLVEMGRHSIMVVSSGIKSILDIERTLEYLETQGVCVMSFGASKHFPAFYCEESGFMAPYHVSDPAKAADILYHTTRFGMGSGILLAVPVPKAFSIDRKIMDTAIDVALAEASRAGVQGKDVTPFLLEKMNRITDGKSLETNVALIKNNALVGAQVAVAYQKIKDIESDSSTKQPSPSPNRCDKKVTVIGGSVLDIVVSLHCEIKTDGRSMPSKIRQSCGGVGRNIADCLGKLRPFCDDKRRPSVRLLSAVGDDSFGTIVLESVKHLDASGVQVVENGRTASYCGFLDLNGDAKIGAGDMSIHSKISSNMVSDDYRKMITDSCFVVLDGNIPYGTMETVVKLSQELDVPVWFEPTDILKAAKPFRTDLWKSISCTSPNVNELKIMAAAAGANFDEQLKTDDTSTLLNQLIHMARPLSEHIPLIMITMGKLGLLMISWETSGPLMSILKRRRSKLETQLKARYYPALSADVVSSIGAGDSTVAGFIDGLLRQCDEAECVSLGYHASKEVLRSHSAVPEEFVEYPIDNISSSVIRKAKYSEIHIPELKVSGVIL